jgi:peptidoglycan/xylan/chitin deacetylase (PgdA/CDA1 family)
MSQEQARVLALHGNDIADHTRHHLCLSGVSAATGLSEIEGGARDIERFVGERPVTLAWPRGCLDATSISAARRSGIFLAFTTASGCHESLPDRLAAPRIRVHRWTRPAALLRLLAPCR